MSDVFPGAEAATGRVETLQAAVGMANQCAKEAGGAGSFAVGGVLVGPDFEVLAVSRNRVIQNGKVVDPTAHGERQLVDWYYAHQDRLPPGDQLTIFSSLDPCMMCTGAILSAGMRVVSLTLDPENGVNWDATGKYRSLPDDLCPQAQRTFAYLGVEHRRPYQGFQPFLFADDTVPEETIAESETCMTACCSAIQ